MHRRWALQVKPWDDETDLVEMEKLVRGVVLDGLLWGSSKLVEVGYGIKKLQISCVVEDDKVGTDDLEEALTAFEDLVSLCCHFTCTAHFGALHEKSAPSLLFCPS